MAGAPRTRGARARAAALLEPPPVVFRVNPRAEDAEARLDADGIVSRTPLIVPGRVARCGTAA